MPSVHSEAVTSECAIHTHPCVSWLSIIIRGDVETISHQIRKVAVIMFSYVNTVGQLSQI